MLRISYILLHLWISEKIIAKIKVFFFKAIHKFILFSRLPRSRKRSIHHRRNFAIFPHFWPAIFIPHHRSQKGLSSKMVLHQWCIRPMQAAGSKADHPPVSVLIFHQISMSRTENFSSAVIPMCEDGIVRTWFIWTIWSCGSLNRLHMPVLCSAFCQHQIIISISFINMRSLRKFPAAAKADFYAWCQLFSGKWIHLTHLDHACTILPVPRG